MLQKILKFEGVKVLEKKTQYAINGGKRLCGHIRYLACR